MAVRLLAGDDDVVEALAGADRLGEFGIELLGHDQEPRATVVEHETVIVFGEQRVDRHRHHAGFDRAEKSSRRVDRIDEQKSARSSRRTPSERSTWPKRSTRSARLP